MILVRGSRKNTCPLPIHSSVGLVALNVFIAVFNHGNEQHNQEWKHGQTRANSSELRKKLQNHKNKEKDVGHTTELFQKILEHKVVDCVLGSDNLVRREEPLAANATSCIVSLFWKVHINHDPTRSRWRALALERRFRVQVNLFELVPHIRGRRTKPLGSSSLFRSCVFHISHSEEALVELLFRP